MFIYIKDVISANLYAYEFYEDNKNDWYEVGCGESRTFEDVLDILKISYSYFNRDDIPKGYQFNTKSKPMYWMYGWEPKWNLEDGLKDYLDFLRIK